MSDKTKKLVKPLILLVCVTGYLLMTPWLYEVTSEWGKEISAAISELHETD